jgi:hypothetical protein
VANINDGNDEAADDCECEKWATANLEMKGKVVTVAVHNEGLQEASSLCVSLGGKLNFCFRLRFTPHRKRICRACGVPIPFLLLDRATEGRLYTNSGPGADFESLGTDQFFSRIAHVD